MENRKKIVHLTEGQLHNVIKESVKQVLSELDWKTYMNAADKMRKERGSHRDWEAKGLSPRDAWIKAGNARLSAGELAQAARDAFDRDFGYQRGNNWYDKDYQRVGMGGDFEYGEQFGPHAAGWKHSGVADIKEFPHGVYTTERTPEEFFRDNPDAAQAYNRARDEMRNYKKGNYNYQSGKGWVKNC